MYEQFMSDFAHRDSAPWQVQLFISFVNRPCHGFRRHLDE